jgi:hypothetical protein
LGDSSSSGVDVVAASRLREADGATYAATPTASDALTACSYTSHGA